MATNTPVICSDKSCLPEIGGNAVLIFESHSERSLIDCYKKLENDKNLRHKLCELADKRISNFAWEKSANEVLEVYEMMRW